LKTLVDLLERLTTGVTDAAAFHKEMNEESATSDYCTWYLRVVTATHLKQDPDRFLPFIDQPSLDIQQFCQREVEPMGKECQHVQDLALAEALGVHVKIEYLDGHGLVNGKLAQHTFGPDTAVTHLALLYRPGHYDILTPK
jgi:ubiquitin thioesterase protein OTUB1